MSNSKTTTHPNVLAEVALIIQVQTGGYPENVRYEDISVEDVVERDLSKSIVDAVLNSEEVKHAQAILFQAASKHSEKYPNTKIFFTPCTALKEYEELPNG